MAEITDVDWDFVDRESAVLARLKARSLAQPPSSSPPKAPKTETLNSEIDRAKQKVLLVEHAIASVKFAAEEERRITHDKHIDQHYVEALDRLDVKLTGARAYLGRIEALGR